MMKKGNHNSSRNDSSSRSGGSSSPADASKKKAAKFVPVHAKTSSELELEEIESLKARLLETTPESGVLTKSSGEKIPFSSLPLSSRTLTGLAMGKLEFATDIQAATLPHALAGRDILGAAKTGSGKTLSFVIPMLEKLFMERWGKEDGLGALIIAPTRELALQIFEVLRIVGRKHQFSAGLVTGGKSEFEGEQARIIGMNILVATPGRLLQHFEQTPNFDASPLQVLILDEADRILDMGFNQQVDAIISYLPSHRQTMLFSATQTKSVKDLARLSLNSPEYIAVHANDETSTPTKLVQNYVVCKLTEKLDNLFSFIKTHLKSKMIIFFSTCNQVRYVYELFRGMQPGIPLTSLHGKIKQERRSIIYMDFVKRSSVCMLATDIAARGLDFPDVDWVVQVDAPEDKAMYIHRVGRTARYVSGGRSLLLLLPNEENSVISELKQGGVPITKLTVNPQVKVSVANRAAALLAAEPEWKVLAKKAFLGYLRSLQMLPNRQIDVSTLPLDAYATSLGLPFTPAVPIIKEEKEREVIRDQKNVNRTLDKLKKQIKESKLAKKKENLRKKLIAEGNDPEDVDEIVEEMYSESKDKKSRDDSKEKIKSSTSKPFDSSSGGESGSDDDSDKEDFFQVKAKGAHLDSKSNSNSMAFGSDDDDEDDLRGGSSVVKISSKKLEKMKQKKEKLRIFSDGEVANKGLKVSFDEDGNAFESFKLVNDQEENTYAGSGKSNILADYSRRTDIVKARLEMSTAEDTKREKDRVKNLHREQRMKRKAPLSAQADAPTLAGYSEDDAVDDEGNDDYNDDNDNDNEGDSYDRNSDEEKDEDDTTSKKKRKKESKKKEKKNKRSKSQIDEDEDEDESNDMSLDNLRKQEELVLKLLGK